MKKRNRDKWVSFLNDIKCNICDKRRGDNLVYVGGEMILRPFPRNAEEDIILCYASKNSR